MIFDTNFISIINEGIKFLCHYSCSLYIFLKVANVTSNRKKNIIVFFTALLLFVLLATVEISCGINKHIIKTFFIIITCVSFIIISHKGSISSIPLSLVTISISYCVEYFSVFLAGSLLYIFGYRNNDIISTICTSVFQILLSTIIVRIKPFRKFFSYIGNENNFGFGLLISSYVLTFYMVLANYDQMGYNEKTILALGIPMAAVGLVLWIKSIVERHYKRVIADRADQYTQQEIADKDAYIQQLEAEVATLAKQLHRDNHLLSSLDRSAQMLVTTDSAQEREKLVDEIHTLYRERNDMITKDQQANKLLPSTGISLIDGALSDMYVKATAHGINFDLIVSEPIHYLVNNIISQTDLQTLLCDHIKDAIIAIDAADITNGKILVTIEKNEGIFEISIRDNGVDFELDTLAKLGIERVTTHADDGGSGIGFMTTFETLAKAKGSLIITEYKIKTPFSKAVTFSFDGLHRFIISSYRKEELKEKISRDDIIYL